MILLFVMPMLNNMKLEVPTFDNTYPYFEKKAQEIAPYKTSNLKPNLILWLQESTIDTKIYRGLGELSMFLDAPNLKYKKLRACSYIWRWHNQIRI